MSWVLGAVFYPLPDEEVRVEVESPSSINRKPPPMQSLFRTYANTHIIDAVTPVNWELIHKFDITSIVSHFRACVIDTKIQ
jgi:hypothetical protein